MSLLSGRHLPAGAADCPQPRGRERQRGRPGRWRLPVAAGLQWRTGACGGRGSSRCARGERARPPGAGSTPGTRSIPAAPGSGNIPGASTGTEITLTARGVRASPGPGPLPRPRAPSEPGTPPGPGEPRSQESPGNPGAILGIESTPGARSRPGRHRPGCVLSAGGTTGRSGGSRTATGQDPGSRGCQKSVPK